MTTIIANLSVKEVYNKIATQFDNTRQRIWTVVKSFMDTLPSHSHVLELGCGNGKNMLYRGDLYITGIDISEEQVRICKAKGLHVTEGTITSLDFPANSFDTMICIATYHHLDNDDDRQRCLKEMYRCLKSGGQILITVWAMEQEPTSNFHFTQTNSMVPWKSRTDNNTYLRYYHIYQKSELLDEVQRLCPELTPVRFLWDQGNWNLVLQK